MLAELWEKTRKSLARFLDPEKPVSEPVDREDDEPDPEIEPMEEIRPELQANPPAAPAEPPTLAQDAFPAPQVPEAQEVTATPTEPPQGVVDGMSWTSTLPRLARKFDTESQPIPAAEDSTRSDSPNFIRFQDPAPQADGSPRVFSKPSEHQIERLIANAEDDMALPTTRKVRIPPELAGQDVPPPKNGFQLAGANSPSQQTSPVVGGTDKPMTERQGDQLLRAMDEHKNILNGIKTSIDTLSAAIQNLATSMKDYGGVVA